MFNIYLMAEPYVDHSAVFYSMPEAATKSVSDGGMKIDRNVHRIRNMGCLEELLINNGDK
jgi:hypothetical protein